jgi:two-component system, OmpR family, sensor kinase
MIETIRARLTVWYVSALALALAVAGVAIYVLLARALEDRVDGNLRSLMTIAATSLGNDLAEGQDVADAARSTATELASADQMLAIFSPDGRLLAEAGREPDLLVSLPIEGVLPNQEPLVYTATESDERDDRHRIAIQRLTLQPSGVQYIVMAGNSLEAADDELASLRSVLLLVGPLMILAAAIGGWILARQSLAPVMAMADRARRISGEADGGRLPIANPRDELGRLAQTFNELLDRVGASLSQQRQFMADASHELRTPVATARTAASVALQQQHREESDYRDTLQIIEQQAIRLSRIVEDMFLLARTDTGHVPLRKMRMYLDEVLADVARSARVLYASRHITIEVTGETGAAVVGDEALITRLFVNLLDNAVRYSPDFSTIRIELRRTPAGYEASVSDQGSGIPGHAHASVFERFFRGDPSRSRDHAPASGAGLGLPLARWIARAHGGDVVLAGSSPAGTTFKVSLAADEEALP